MKKERVLLGMSGGTDSSVAAIMLQEHGFEVVGITFIFSDLQANDFQFAKDAEKLARKLNIEHHTYDLRDEFQKKVISYFIDGYSSGLTPFPCAVCNPELKFHHLFLQAQQQNCDYISTGHYVKVVEKEGVKYISEGVDSDKDQSFFLWGLRKSVIQKLVFPLGNYTKKEVRDFAKSKGFDSISRKKDSLGICFIENGNYRKFLQEQGISNPKGNYVNAKGEILGKHSGICNYTIGQRRGLGLELNKPLFVTEIRFDKNEIELGEFKELYKTKITIENYQFVDIESIIPVKIYIVKIRYRLQRTFCNIRILNEKSAEVALNEPVAMVAKGQTAVFYEDNHVIGGGFILAAE